MRAEPAAVTEATAATAPLVKGPRWLLPAGALLLAAVLAAYLADLVTHLSYMAAMRDLVVYRNGGLIVRHVSPAYDPHHGSPLYDWTGQNGVQFTYPPFAAVIFSVASVLSWTAMRWAMTLASLAALGLSLWLVFGALGYRDRPAIRLGATLGVSALALATEPVQQTLALGQVNLLLMLLVVADLLTGGALTPGGRTRWWHGLGIGIAAGVKLTPLIFIPYLLLIRRYRQAAMASGVFAATVALGYAILPRDSGTYWAHGLFLKANRIVFLGTRGNQSLRGVLTRLAGSVSAGTVPWIAAAVLVVVAGLVAAALLYRARQPVPAMLACALTGLLVSPLSWDHHWVWVAPGIALLAHLGATAARRAGPGRVVGGRGGPVPRLRLLAAVLEPLPVRPDPGGPGLVRAGHLLRDRQQALVPRVPLARPAAAGREQRRAGRAGLPGRPGRGGRAALCHGAAPGPRTPQGTRKAQPVTDGTSLAGLRERLVAEVLQTSGIRDERIAAALRDVPRHLFLPHLPPEDAYLDDAIVTKRDADGQPISSSSQPAIMAIMLDQLTLAPGQRVLEIGAGTGYNAALMRHIVGPSGTVVSVDIDADLADRAREHLASAGYPDVTVVAADGAEGYPPGAPYDRVIATVGVSDLAPAWLHQAGPGARIVVPLDVRGSQLAVAFGRSGSGGHWVSRSIAPCGFMRMRGSLAGPERTVVLQPGLSVMLPDGLTLADGHEVDGAALAAFLDEPPAGFATGVRASSVQVFWGLGLWLATRDRRSCGVTEERPAGNDPGRLARAPLAGTGMAATAGIVDSGGIAVLTADERSPRPGRGRASWPWRWPGSARTAPSSAPPSPRTCRPGTRQVSPARRGCTWTPIRGRRRTSQTRPRPAMPC